MSPSKLGRGRLAALAFVLAAHTSATVAQTPPASPGPDAIRALLLRTSAWTVEFGPRSRPTAWAATMVFADRDGTLIATMDSAATGWQCERPVALSADGFSYRGCSDRPISIKLDPNDDAVPFKGRDGYDDYVFRFIPKK